MGGNYFLGRQPIYDAAMEVHGYELLFRGGDGIDGNAMTADVLVRAGLDLGLTAVVGDKLAYVNAPRAFLAGDLDWPLPPKLIVVEVLESLGRDAEIVDGCRRLVEAGYALALDDYCWMEGDPLLPLASIVKLDLLSMPPDELPSQMERCGAFGARLLAEKVETSEQLERCRQLGFDYFQGYALARPELLSATSLTPSKLTLLGLIDKIFKEDTSTNELQEMVESDPVMSLRLLRVAGTGASRGMRRPVRSIREAIVILGRQPLRSWLLLMLAGEAGSRPGAETHVPLCRARMCERLMQEQDPDLGDAAFTVGLVSGLDQLLGVPLDAIVAHLSLEPALVAALLGRGGPLGEVLDDVVGWHVGRLLTGDSRSGLATGQIEAAYIEALRWSLGIEKLASLAA